MRHITSSTISWLRSLLTSVLLILSFTAPVAESQADPQARRPNIIVIVSDDQRFDQLSGVMPVTERRIFSEGARFERAYISNPSCCPSRASILTGLYASRHKVLRNPHKLTVPTVAHTLSAAGYRTGLVGKYLNTWSGAPRPEFDFWAAFAGGSAPYFNPFINVNGKWKRRQGYITKLLGGYAEFFIRQSLRSQQPFFLYFAPNAPHDPAVPAADTRSLFSDSQFPRYPNFNEPDRSDKPDWVKNRAARAHLKARSLDKFWQNQLRCLWTLDQQIARLLGVLEAYDALSHTAIFYISDNGIYYGEHTLLSKAAAYEEAIRVPFGLRFPPVTGEGGHVISALVANIDIAPTIYEIAKAPLPYELDGLSLTRLFDGSSEWREALLLESWRRRQRTPFTAIHTGDTVYIENHKDLPELYSLIDDPYQLDNRVHDDAYYEQERRLAAQLENLLIAKRGSTTFLQPKPMPGRTRFPFSGSKFKRSPITRQDRRDNRREARRAKKGSPHRSRKALISGPVRSRK